MAEPGRALSLMMLTGSMLWAESVTAAGRGRIAAAARIDFAELSERPEARPAGARRVHRHRRVTRQLAPGAPAAPAVASEPPATASPAATPAYTGFQGLLDNFVAIPADAGGAVSPQHVMTFLNSEVLIQNRDGSVAKRAVSLDSFWSAVTPGGEAYDPRVLYDAAARRWIASAAVDAELASSALVFAVSQTGDPTGNWNLFKVDVGPKGLWADYPVLGVNANWVSISVNLFALTRNSPYRRTDLYILNKADFYNNARTTYAVFNDNQGEFIPAVDIDNTSATRMFFLQAFSDFGAGVVRVSDVHGAVGSEIASFGLKEIDVPDSWSGAAPNGLDFLAQLGSAVKIDAGDDRMQNCMLRAGAAWCAHTIFLPFGTPRRTAVQWFQIDPVRYTITQRGRIDDAAGVNSFAYPSIAVNRNGDALIGYNRFSATQHVSANFSFRASGDPPNTLQADTVFKPGEAPYVSGLSGSNRWGDFSVTVVDPADDLAFWTIQQYAATPGPGHTGRWGTWWAKVVPSAGTTCTFSVTGLQQFFDAAGGSGTFGVTAPAGCPWSAASNASWIAVTGGASGEGAGTVRFTVGANSGALRTGTLLAAGQTATITQAAPAALPDLVMTAMSAPASAAPSATITVALTVRNQGSVGAGPFRAGVYLGQGDLPGVSDALLGECVSNGLAAGASQSCSPQVTLPTSLAAGAYTIGAVADYLNSVPESDEGNNARAADTGRIAIGGRPAFTAAGIGNAASYLGGAVAPGEIVTIFGSGLGPATLVSAGVTAGVADTAAGGTRVLFDEAPAPMVYARQDQISAIVPFGVEGRAATSVVVEFNGARSAAVSMPVAAAAPGIFTLDGSGRGQGAILNQDYTFNSPGQAAAPGSAVMIYATGGGRMTATQTDGALAQPPYAELAQPVTVRIAGVPARVLYAGAAPGLVAGALQINAVVPDGVAPGDRVSVELTVGTVSAASGVTMAVR